MNVTRHFPTLALIAACALAAQAVPAVSREESKARQAELNHLRSQLDQLKKNLAANESQKAEAADALRSSEKAISEANRVLTDLSEERQLTATELAALEKDIAQARVGIRQSQQRLAQLLKSRYKTGQLEVWKLLLNQQDPNRVSRELTYYRHISQAQLELARKLENQLAELNRLAQEIRQRNDVLKRIAQDKLHARAQLVEGQREKTQQLAKLSQKINSQRNQIQKLVEDEKRMSTLVKRLNELIRKQEAERARLAAKRRAERERQARLARNAVKPGEKPAVAPVINDDLPDPALSGQAFAALKGKLRLPLRGEVISRFGTARSERTSWKGVFIRSNAGQPVKAVASGQVIFADWMRGFGNLLILDHGGGYMTIYAANESLLKRVGDQIKAGDSIATSGNSGGMGDSGVYFELRHNGKPLDPMSWIGG